MQLKTVLMGGNGGRLVKVIPFGGNCMCQIHKSRKEGTDYYLFLLKILCSPSLFSELEDHKAEVAKTWAKSVPYSVLLGSRIVGPHVLLKS